jgi:N-acetylglucosaminyl-diphospho-decaprenol L-rhamnosyltransferase
MTGAADTPRIAVVIVTYNSTPVLADCLRSLAESDVPPAAVVVADNASKDGSLAFAEAATDLPVRTVQLGRNAGYSAAINVAVASLGLKVDAIFVMNPDCRVRPDTLRRLAAILREPGRGIAVPRIMDPAGHTHPSLRRAPTVRGALTEAVIGGTRAGRAGGAGEMVTDPAAYERPGPAIWATGAAMLISTEAWRDIGPWDESFLLYSEETDYALRAGDNGWILWYEPAAVVTHIGGEAKTNPRLAALLAVNKVRLFRLRRGRTAGSAYWAAVLLGEGIRAATGKRNARAAALALIGPSRRSRKLVD